MRDPDSPLSRMRSLIERYREAPELAWGRCEVLDTVDPGVMAHLSSLPEGAVLAVHNFSGRQLTAVVEVPGLRGGRLLTDLADGGTVKAAAGGRIGVGLEAYGYRWLRVNTPLDDPDRAVAE